MPEENNQSQAQTPANQAQPIQQSVQNNQQDDVDELEKAYQALVEDNKILMGSFADLAKRMDNSKSARDKEPTLANEAIPLMQMMLEQQGKLIEITGELLNDDPFDDFDEAIPAQVGQGVSVQGGQSFQGAEEDGEFVEVSAGIIAQATQLLTMIGFAIPSGVDSPGVEYIKNGFAARRMLFDLLADIEPQDVAPVMYQLSKQYPNIDIYKEIGYTDEQKNYMISQFEEAERNLAAQQQGQQAQGQGQNTGG